MPNTIIHNITARTLVLVAVFLLIVAAILEAQVLQQDTKIEELSKTVVRLEKSSKETKVAANKAAVAAESADTSLREAIEQSRQTQAGSGDALKQIAEIHACVIRKEC